MLWATLEKLSPLATPSHLFNWVKSHGNIYIYIYSTNIFTKWVEVEFEVKAYPYINGTYMKKFMWKNRLQSIIMRLVWFQRIQKVLLSAQNHKSLL